MHQQAGATTSCGPIAARQAGEAHPVLDFLFTYYSLRPRQLRRGTPASASCSPAPAAQRYLGRSGYGAGATVWR